MNLLAEMTAIFALAASSSEEKVKSDNDIEGNEKLLAKMVEAEDFDGMVEFAEGVKDWDKLGVGSSRTIYQISESLILKIAHNDKGISQNLAEMSMQGFCLNNVLVADSKGRWVIVRFTETMKEEDFKDYVGFGFKPFMSCLHDAFNNEDHDNKPNNYDEIIKHPIYQCLSKLTLKHQLQLGDVGKCSSWGLLEGRPVLRDFGLTKDIYREHYKSDSSSSSSAATDTDTTKSESRVKGNPSSKMSS